MSHPDPHPDPQPDSQPAPAHIVVEQGGQTHSCSWDPQDTLLEALLKAGIDAPYGCQQGECGACECVVSGPESSMDRNMVLSEQDVKEGYRLACQTRQLRAAGDRDSQEFLVRYWF